MNEALSTGQRVGRFIERAGHLIPDPVIIFMAFYPAAFILTVIFGGYQFSTTGAGGESVDRSGTRRGCGRSSSAAEPGGTSGRSANA